MSIVMNNINIIVELREDSDPKTMMKFMISTLKYQKKTVRHQERKVGHQVKGWRKEIKKTGGSEVASLGFDDWNFNWENYRKVKKDVRCRHIAIGILRGRSIRQIETLPTNPKKRYIQPDWKLISKYVAEGIYFYGMKSQEKPSSKRFGELVNQMKFPIEFKNEETVSGRVPSKNPQKSNKPKGFIAKMREGMTDYQKRISSI